MSDSEKLVRKVELKQSDNWKLQCFFSPPNFVVRVLIRFVDVAKVIAERNYVLSFCSHELLDYNFSEKFDSFCVFRTFD